MVGHWLWVALKHKLWMLTWWHTPSSRLFWSSWLIFNWRTAGTCHSLTTFYSKLTQSLHGPNIVCVFFLLSDSGTHGPLQPFLTWSYWVIQNMTVVVHIMHCRGMLPNVIKTCCLSVFSLLNTCFFFFSSVAFRGLITHLSISANKLFPSG